jgi:hypothetical protein
MNIKQFSNFLRNSYYLVPQDIGFLIAEFSNFIDEETDIVLQEYLGSNWNETYVFVYKREGMILYVYRPLYNVAMERECFYFYNYYYENNYGGIYKRNFYELETEDNERSQCDVVNDMRSYVKFPLCQVNYYWEEDMRQYSRGIVSKQLTWEFGNYLNAQADMESNWVPDM